jgi:hypothetical protein
LETAGERVRLHPLEREFLGASTAADRAELVGVRRRTRRLRAMVAALSVLLLVAAGAVVVATNLRADAVGARQLSLSRQLATSSELAVGVDPRRTALSALGAWQAAPTVEARSVLLATAADAFRGRMPAHASLVSSVATAQIRRNRRAARRAHRAHRAEPDRARHRRVRDGRRAGPR